MAAKDYDIIKDRILESTDEPYIPPYKQDMEYLLVTLDKYELPLYSANSPQRIAEYTGLTVGSVMSAISRGNPLRGLNAKVIRVKI